MNDSREFQDVESAGSGSGLHSCQHPVAEIKRVATDGSGAEPHCNRRPDSCGFVVLTDPRHQLETRHGSVDVVPPNIGFGRKDHTWHYEQWLHLKFTERKRRRDASLADSKSRQKDVPRHKS